MKFVICVLFLISSSAALAGSSCEGYSEVILKDFLKTREDCAFTVLHEDESHWPYQTDIVQVSCPETKSADGKYTVNMLLSEDGWQDSAPVCDPTTQPVKITN